MGDYPTLEELNNTFGEMTAPEWLVILLVDLCIFSGVKNMDKAQIKNLSLILADEYKSLKYSEFQLFLYRFKMGDFGIFYGSVDPMVITTALKKFTYFLKEKRCEFIYEENLRKKEEIDLVRESHKKRWLECRDALVEASPDELAKSVFLDMDYYFFDESNKTLYIYACKQQYDIIEKKYLDILKKVVNQYYPGIFFKYHLYSPWKKREYMI